MQWNFEDIFGIDLSSLDSDEMACLKKRMTERIVDIYFESDLTGELRARVIAWLLDGENADAKAAAIQRRFDKMFAETADEEPARGKRLR